MKITSTYLKVLKLLPKNVEEILFGGIFLGIYTGQTISKHVWVRQCNMQILVGTNLVNEKEKKKLNPIYIRENNLVSRQFMCMCSSSKTVFIKIGICILKSFLTTTTRVLFLFLRLGKRNLSYFGIHSVH